MFYKVCARGKANLLLQLGCRDMRPRQALPQAQRVKKQRGVLVEKYVRSI